MLRSIVFVMTSNTTTSEICCAKEVRRLPTAQPLPKSFKSALMPAAFLDCDELAGAESGESFAEGCGGPLKSEIGAACQV